MLEMPRAGEKHGDTAFIAGGNGVLIALRSAGLNDRSDHGLHENARPIAEG